MKIIWVINNINKKLEIRIKQYILIALILTAKLLDNLEDKVNLSMEEFHLNDLNLRFNNFIMSCINRKIAYRIIIEV